jgi:WhiB family transcriptional regulator, redox-sensing transcriptional regulator
MGKEDITPSVNDQPERLPVDKSDVDLLLEGLFVKREEWMGKAACRGMSPDLFYPGKGESSTEAKETCSICPVTKECLDYALLRDEYGVWAGTSIKDRKKLKRSTEA